MWLHWGCMLVPFMLSAYMIQAALLLVVPIMGRSGSGNHAESVMSLITSAMFTLVFSFYVSNITAHTLLLETKFNIILFFPESFSVITSKSLYSFQYISSRFVSFISSFSIHTTRISILWWSRQLSASKIYGGSKGFSIKCYFQYT